jgi:2-keto-4-pentenoate hydratase/2-oxohepta-3-ene-1,7-dioic acid hydratase in catechol pathway
LKLIRCCGKKGECYEALLDGKVICLPCLAKQLGKTLPERLEDFISLGEKGVEIAKVLLKEASEREIKSATSTLREEAIMAPIAFPPKIICLGLNYRDHIDEQKATTPEEPIIFIKPHTTIIGPNENIVKPNFVKRLDYEAELAIVIGRKAKNVSVAEAESVIFGYTILNDVSARDLQFKDKQWTRGKSCDTFAPTGPCITTTDQIRDTSNLRIRTWVNNELRQDSTTKKMVFSVNEIVHHISRIMTLEPCDIIATGTPKGVGFALKPIPKFLKDGDVVRIEIEGVGVLENRVIEEKQ